MSYENRKSEIRQNRETIIDNDYVPNIEDDNYTVDYTEEEVEQEEDDQGFIVNGRRLLKP